MIRHTHQAVLPDCDCYAQMDEADRLPRRSVNCKRIRLSCVVLIVRLRLDNISSHPAHVTN